MFVVESASADNDDCSVVKISPVPPESPPITPAVAMLAIALLSSEPRVVNAGEMTAVGVGFGVGRTVGVVVADRVVVEVVVAEGVAAEGVVVDEVCLGVVVGTGVGAGVGTIGTGVGTGVGAGVGNGVGRAVVTVVVLVVLMVAVVVVGSDIT